MLLASGVRSLTMHLSRNGARREGRGGKGLHQHMHINKGDKDYEESEGHRSFIRALAFAVVKCIDNAK